MKKLLSHLKNFFSFYWRKKWLTIPATIVFFIILFIIWPKPSKPIPEVTVGYSDLTVSLSVTGTAVAKSQANLTFPIGGTINWIGVKKGDFVQKFQTIATLDQRTVLKNLQTALLTYGDQRNTFDQTIESNQNSPLTSPLQRVLASNQNDLNKAVVSVELQDLARQQSILFTPIAGIVTRMDTQVPNTTATLGTTTFTVTDPNSMVFDADVDQADIGKVQTGLPVQITFDAYPSDTLTESVSNIDFVSHTTGSNGTAYTVETTLPDNSSYRYRVGMSANAEIILDKQSHVLTIPLSSLVDNSYVYIKQGSTYKKQKVTLGLENDTDAQVTSGLSQGDIIAADPTQVPKH